MNGKKKTEMNTTHIKEPIEQKEKQKVGQLLETISLRDYFAAKALPAILEQMDVCNGKELTNSAWIAYQMADAMLKVREA